MFIAGSAKQQKLSGYCFEFFLVAVGTTGMETLMLSPITKIPLKAKVKEAEQCHGEGAIHRVCS